MLRVFVLVITGSFGYFVVSLHFTFQLVSLSKHSGISISEFRELPRDEEEGSLDFDLGDEFDALLRSLDFNVSNSESAIIFYVAGYITHSLSKKVACSMCKQMFVTDRTMPEGETSEEYTFLHMMSQGGLKSPSDFLYLFCKCVFSVFLGIKSSTHV